MRSLRLRRIVGVARQLLVALLAIACLAALSVSCWLAAQTPAANQAATNQRQTTGSDIPSAQDPKALQQEAEKLRGEAEKLREESTKLQAALDGQRREADGFRWLLTVVLGLGALYSFFQVVYSYLNVQELKGQAQKAIDDVEKLRKNTADDLNAFQKDLKTTAGEDFQKFQNKCEIQFPMFMGFETALGQMFSRLEALLKFAAVGDNIYRMLDDPLDREEIYYYEKSAASLQFVEVSSPGRLFHIFRRFSRFYLDKYRAEREDRKKRSAAASASGVATSPGGAEDPNDLNRARYYLYRADSLAGSKKFLVSNDRGFMAIEVGASPDWAEATKWYQDSANLQAEQQCAHYNLATIDHFKAAALVTSDQSEAKKLFEAAVRRLRVARTYTNWDDTPSPKKATSIDYNLACGLSRLAGMELDAPVKVDLLKESFEALERAVTQAPEERGSFEEDRKVGKDLNPLNADPGYQPKLDAFVVAIRKARI